MFGEFGYADEIVAWYHHLLKNDLQQTHRRTVGIT